MAMKIDTSMWDDLILAKPVTSNPVLDAAATKRAQQILKTPYRGPSEIDPEDAMGWEAPGPQAPTPDAADRKVWVDDEPRVYPDSFAHIQVERAPGEMSVDELYAELEGVGLTEEERIALLEEAALRDNEWIEESLRVDTAVVTFAKLVDDNFPWDESQTEAIVGLSKEPVGCLIGAAGTGKTTCEKRLVDILLFGDEKLGLEPMRMKQVNLLRYWERHGGDDEAVKNLPTATVPSILLCSYTGQATQNIKKNFPSHWHGNIMTIHSALGYYPEHYETVDPQTGKPKNSMRFVPYYNKTIQMPWDVVIIDEASMTNLDLWHQLLDAAKPGCRFYMIGDINQLPPPIGQGILGFAMAKWPVFELRHIHRQKEAAANRIIETAWGVLQGETPVFDDPKTNKDWRVIGMPIEHEPSKAARQIISIAEAMRGMRISVVEDTKDGLVTNPGYQLYDPWRDRILTCMNGYNSGDPASPIGQAPLNEVLALLFSNKEDRTVIDAGREIKRFCVGYRVMATKNESPSQKDRVTNGMTGIITDILQNPDYNGDVKMFGKESLVKEYRKNLLDLMNAQGSGLENADFDSEDIANAITTDIKAKEDRIQGAASHSITVNFNGIHRVFRLKAEVESLQIAYASTVHKTQGSEMDTVIVVVHHAQKKMLCRESLYTAVTRAQKRLVILYTPHGLKLSLAKQKIFGKTIQEKVRQYLMLVGEVDGTVGTLKVRLSKED